MSDRQPAKPATERVSTRVTFDGGDWPAVREAVTRRMAELEPAPRDLQTLTSLSAHSVAKLRSQNSTGAMHTGTLRQASEALGWPGHALADLAQHRITLEELANPDPAEPELHERFQRLEDALRQLHAGLTEIAQLEEERATKLATVLAEVGRLAGLLEAPDLIRVRLAAKRGHGLPRHADTVRLNEPNEADA